MAITIILATLTTTLGVQLQKIIVFHMYSYYCMLLPHTNGQIESWYES